MTKPHFYWYVGLNWRLPIMCSSLSLEWFERTVRTLDLTVYDPLFTNVYEAFVHDALNKQLMELLKVFSDDLSDYVAALEITLQSIRGEMSLFKPRGKFI